MGSFSSASSNGALNRSLQVILTSSLENTAFGMTGIKYFNAVSQFLMAGLVISIFLFFMGNKPKAYVPLSRFAACFTRLKSCQVDIEVQDLHHGFRHPRDPCHLHCRDVFDPGCYLGRLGVSAHAVRHYLDLPQYVFRNCVTATFLKLTCTSVCAVERARVRSVVHVHQLHPTYAPIANPYQHSPDVHRPCPDSCQKLTSPA